MQATAYRPKFLASGPTTTSFICQPGLKALPFAAELKRLPRAALALGRLAVRGVVGRGAPPHASSAAVSAPQHTGARRESGKPVAGARAAASRPVTAAGAPRARRGETQAKILAALDAAPGSTTAAVSHASGVPNAIAAATISRLVKQGHAQRLAAGGYQLADPPAPPIGP